MHRYATTYLAMRTVIGGLAGLLPVALILVDWGLITDTRFMAETRGVRSSMSAYYHSAARDLLVAGLCVIGVLLLTYLIGQGDLAGNLVSSLAGLALIVVAVVPTQRDATGHGPYCGLATETPPGCTPLQDVLTEPTALLIHQVAAAVFVGCLFLLTVRFIRDEARRLRTADGQTSGLAWREVPAYLARGCNPVYLTGALMICAAGVILLLGRSVTVLGVRLEPVYLSELAVFFGFTLSWVVVSRGAFSAIETGGPGG